MKTIRIFCMMSLMMLATSVNAQPVGDLFTPKAMDYLKSARLSITCSYP